MSTLTGADQSHEVFFLVGDNRIELVPQRTSFEGAKRRANAFVARRVVSKLCLLTTEDR